MKNVEKETVAGGKAGGNSSKVPSGMDKGNVTAGNSPKAVKVGGKNEGTNTAGMKVGSY